MFFEIILLSVVVVTVYIGPTVLRRQPPGHRAYGYMLLADCALAIVAFAARRSEGPGGTGDALGAVAMGACVFLVVVPPFLRDVSRRALMTDRLRLAMFINDIRELLQPGMGARQENELVAAIMAVRSGRVDEAIEVYKQTRAQLDDPLARRQVDERIVFTYLRARRWDDAVDYYENQLRGGPASPQLLVEMIRAYCEAGQLDEAASLLEKLEESPLAEEPLLALLVNRARMVFLAFVGRTGAVEGIVAPGGPLGMMPPASRHFWSGIARLNAGDKSGARSSLEEAARLSKRDPRARELAEERLGSVDDPGVAGPHAVSPVVAQLADRVANLAAESKPPQASVPRMSGVTWRSVPVTLALVVANIAAALALALVFGSTSDLGAIVRAGGNLKSAVAAGEYWRLVTANFLHVGLLHLALNMFALWVLGKLVEQMFGSVRFFAVYMMAALGGAGASYLVGGPGMSAGASGAVFGVMGAAIAELGIYRSAYPERWRNGLFGLLLFITAAQIGIGFAYDAIDQANHVGGFVTGAVFAVLLSNKSPMGERAPVRVLGLVLALAGAGAIVYGGVSVATTTYADTLDRYERVEQEVGGFRVSVPSAWQLVDGELQDPNPFMSIVLVRDEGDLDEAMAEWLREEEARAGDRNLEKSRRALKNLLELPEPWRGRELELTYDAVGGDQKFRIVVFGRRAGDEIWLGRLFVYEALIADVAPIVGDMLEGLEPLPD